QAATQNIRGELLSCARSDRRNLECCRPLPGHNGVVAFRASGAAVAMTAPLPAALVSRGAITARARQSGRRQIVFLYPGSTSGSDFGAALFPPLAASAM